jgi:gliding motility-associated-like protein
MNNTKSFLHLSGFFSLFICGLLSIQLSYGGSAQNSKEGKNNWSLNNAFQQKVFIENKGQFDGRDNRENSLIKYSVTVGKTQIYFSAQGVTYRYDEYLTTSEEEREEAMEEKRSRASGEKDSKLISHFVNLIWEGANADNQIIPADMVSEYFTYPDLKDESNQRSIKASAFKKIIYQNIYPNIDVEYTFPGSKEGIKYAFILHPGADASQIKMQYSGEGNCEIDSEGNVRLKSSFGDFVDHVPLTTYADNSIIGSAFVLNGKTVSFKLDDYDRTRTVIIDPWVTVPTFAGFNSAYDLEYDLAGNVYVYGGQYPWQEIKFNSSGAIQWTYTAISFYSSGCSGGACYGDFAVDGQSGSSYIVEGFNGGLGARVIKLDAAGAQIGFFPGNNNLGEMWRIVYNNCTKEAIIAGGGISTNYQACILDTNVSAMTPVNVLSAPGAFHDIALLGLDNAGSYYMASARSLADPTFANNVLFKGPSSTLIPLTYSVYNGYNFAEVSSINYVNNVTSNANGFNGLATSANFVYTYDGATLKKWDAAGTLVGSVVVTPTPFSWGGIAVDDCDNIYVGAQASVKVYDVNLGLTNTIGVTNTVYDLKLGPLNKLYVCGNAFVSELLLPSVVCNPLNLTIASSSSCSDGSAIANVTGGTGPYSYSWTPTGQTTQTATGLTPGTYYVTVTDNSCIPKSETDSVVIPPGGTLTLNFAQANVTCFGTLTGSATISPIGGTAPYTYSWNTVPVQTTATATGLGVGNYTVTVNDSNGCVNSQYVTITEPTALASNSSTITNVLCNAGNNGSVTAGVSGGSPSYTYSWLPSGGNGVTASNLTAGIYTVSVTDLNGCIITSTATVTQPTALVANSSTITNVLCNGGNNGSVTVSIVGGSPGYTYSWLPAGGNGATASNLTAGVYTVSVTDLNGCIITSTATITQPTILAANGSTVANVLCNGGTNGSVTVAVNGGTPGYTYSWLPSGGNGVTANNLTAGSYTVAVIDVNGCTITSTANVTQPTALAANGSTITNVLCNGGNNGSLTVSVNGGSPGYTYSWLPSGGNGVTASNLTAGTYTVSVTDLNGCIITSTATITQPTVLVANGSTVTNVLCNGGNNGSVTVAVNGGSPGYTYSWLPSGGNGITASNLTAGNYTVAVIDANGCTITSAANVTQLTSLAANGSTITNVLCNGGNNGSVTTSVSGGSPGYTYSWLPTGGNGATASNLTAGAYTVSVTDFNGCLTTSTATITQPTALAANSSTIANVLCSGGNNGSVSVIANGGSPGYTYSWLPSGGNGVTASNLTVGSYIASVTDLNGCITTSTATITQPTALAANGSTLANVLCNGGNNGSASVSVNGGSPGYTYSWLPSGGNGVTASNLTAGTYTVSVTDLNGCITTSTVTITQPTALAANGSTITNVLCNSGNNGSLTVSVNGGSPGYTYSWLPSGGNGVTASNLTVGVYTVSVTDLNGCTLSSTATVTEPIALAANSTTITNVLCNGENNGSVTVSVSGGSPGYTYSWSPSGGSGVTANNLTAGTYTVAVTDGNGCTLTSSAAVTEPTALGANGTTITNVLCNGGNNGSVAVSVSGGSPGYTYSWMPSGGSGVTANNLTAGTYTVAVTDGNGCSISSSAMVTQPIVLAATTDTLINVFCYGGDSGSAFVTANGGSVPYSFAWSPTGGNAATASNLAAGNYSVTITDANGCSIIRTVTITQPAALSLTVSPSVTICINQSANISASPAGGTIPYIYSWNNGPTTPSQSVSPATTTNYNVLITDANGCTVSQSVTITVHPPLNVSATATPQLCFGNSGIVSAAAVGGNGGPYSYSWSTGQGSASFTDTPSSTTTYTVTLNDGCSPAVQNIATIIINPVPGVGFTPINTTDCVPVSVDFTDTANAIPGCTYLWDFGDGSSLTDANPSHVYTAPGQYAVTLTITTPQGCANTLSLVNVVTANALPVADFTIPQVISLEEAALVQFINLSSGSISWEWDFGDLSEPTTVFNPSHSYGDTGTYTIQLISYSPGLCPDTTYRTLKVNGEFAIYIPNSFTPNGDGMNDTFIAKGIYIKDYDMWILDRWGAKIYHSISLSNPWNGTYFDNGTLCQNDVYIYKIKVRDIFENLHEFVGRVTLVR